MKRFLYALLGLMVSAFGLSSCKKEENKVYLENSTQPVLSANRTATIPLAFATANSEAVKLSWTNPNYQFTTGTSSQNVNYLLEIDTVGANFSSKGKKSYSIASDLSKTFTQVELNDVLLNTLELKAGNTYNVEFRVKASLAGSAATLASNSMRFAVTPYALPPKVAPYTTEVYLVGDATPGGWNNPVPAPAQKMTQVSPTMYELTLNLTGGKSLLFLPENGSWNRKYGFAGSNNSNNPDGDDFTREGGDIKVPAASGNYKVELNFQTGRFKFTKL